MIPNKKALVFACLVLTVPALADEPGTTVPKPTTPAAPPASSGSPTPAMPDVTGQAQTKPADAPSASDAKDDGVNFFPEVRRLVSSTPRRRSSNRSTRFSTPLTPDKTALSPVAESQHTWSITLFLGRGLWDGGEIFVDPEAFQGFGLSQTYGIASGFPNGEAQKMGYMTPHGYLLPGTSSARPSASAAARTPSTTTRTRSPAPGTNVVSSSPSARSPPPTFSTTTPTRTTREPSS